MEKTFSDPFGNRLLGDAFLESQAHEASGKPLGREGGPGESAKEMTTGAALFAFGTLMSRILGLIRDMMIARYFPNDVRDAFINAFRLPNLFRRLFGEGSLSVSFIPIFVDILSGRDSKSWAESDRRARDLVAGVFSLLMSITITLSLLATIFMPDILHALLNGDAYMSVPGKFELTVRLGRIMFCFLILVSLYAFFMAIQNSVRKFAVAALAPCLFNISMIAAAYFSPRFAAPETVLAIGVLVGGFLQMAILIPGVIRAGHFPRLTFAWDSRDVWRVVKAFVPAMIGLSLIQMTIIVNMHFASALPSGSQSYLYLADRILELPLSLFVVSIGSALLPTLARLWSEGNRATLSTTVNHSMRLILFVAVPSALGMFFLARPIVDVLFLGRQFKYVDAVSTAQVIQVYAFVVVAAAGVRILAQGFYAIQNTWFPALAGGVALVSHILFALTLTKVFGLAGLAAASVGSATVNLLMLATAYSKWVGSLEGRKLAIAFGKCLACGVVMVGVLLFHDRLLSFFGTRFFARAFVLMTTIFFGGGVYLLMARLLKVEELNALIAVVTGIERRRDRTAG
jgi:putative peptidoglycan lipid II flippase